MVSQDQKLIGWVKQPLLLFAVPKKIWRRNEQANDHYWLFGHENRLRALMNPSQTDNGAMKLVLNQTSAGK